MTAVVTKVDDDEEEEAEDDEVEHVAGTELPVLASSSLVNVVVMNVVVDEDKTLAVDVELSLLPPVASLPLVTVVVRNVVVEDEETLHVEEVDVDSEAKLAVDELEAVLSDEAVENVVVVYDVVLDGLPGVVDLDSVLVLYSVEKGPDVELTEVDGISDAATADVVASLGVGTIELDGRLEVLVDVLVLVETDVDVDVLVLLLLDVERDKLVEVDSLVLELLDVMEATFTPKLRRRKGCMRGSPSRAPKARAELVDTSSTCLISQP